MQIRSEAQLNTALLEALSDYGKRQIRLAGEGACEKKTQNTLSPAQEKALAKRLLYLPHDAFSAVMGIHYFGCSPKQVNRLFEMTDAAGTALFYTKMLSGFMGLSGGNIISDETMERACNIAMRHYFRDLERNLRPHRHTAFTVLRWAAAVFLILGTLFTARVSVDAAFRERVVKWFMEHFETYSELRLTGEETVDTPAADVWDNAYVPARFTLTEAVETDDVSMYTYLSDDEERLTVLITAGETVLQADTEDKRTTRFQVNGAEVLLISGEDTCQVIFYHKGHQFDIVGNISEDEMKETALEILK